MPDLSALCFVLGGALLAELLHVLVFISKKAKGKSKQEPVNDVLFFPDNCMVAFRDTDRLTQKDLHDALTQDYLDETSTFKRMLEYLEPADRSVDLCMFMLTCKELTDKVIACIKRGGRVRLIVEQQNIGATGCQVNRLRQHGAFVRYRQQPFFMHHKFAIVNGELLINGSFNWTGSAVTGNNENVIITNQPDLVSGFKSEFERLWDVMDPDSRRSS